MNVTKLQWRGGNGVYCILYIQGGAPACYAPHMFNGQWPGCYICRKWRWCGLIEIAILIPSCLTLLVISNKIFQGSTNWTQLLLVSVFAVFAMSVLIQMMFNVLYVYYLLHGFHCLPHDSCSRFHQGVFACSPSTPGCSTHECIGSRDLFGVFAMTLSCWPREGGLRWHCHTSQEDYSGALLYLGWVY